MSPFNLLCQFLITDFPTHILIQKIYLFMVRSVRTSDKRHRVRHPPEIDSLVNAVKLLHLLIRDRTDFQKLKYLSACSDRLA